MTDAVQFGDGFGVAGAVIMHLLGQRHQFELLDFSYHVLNVNNFERYGLCVCVCVCVGGRSRFLVSASCVCTMYPQRTPPNRSR